MRRIVPVALLTIVFGPILPLSLVDDPAVCRAAPAPQETAPAAPYDAGSNTPPDGISSFVVRAYKTREKKLWKGLLDALREEGFSPEEVDDESRIVKTSFVDFKQESYQNQVADPPQQLGNDYHILQMIKVKEGKVSLEGRIAPGQQGTELRLRARILVMGLDRVHRVRVLVDRRSTGVIESGFIHKLEARMGIEHL